MEPERRIITIDGPSGAGKSTLAKRLAAELGWTYLDTGAMYRAVGLAVCEAGGDPDNEDFLAGIMANLDLDVAPGPEATRVFLAGRDVTDLIREPHISVLASRASAHGVVRRAMVELQRKIGRSGRIVAEGRDMGSVVFPGAAVKFFLGASLEERAGRRYRELKSTGRDVMFEKVKADMARRDDDDSSRALSPLRPAPDAIQVDSTDKPIDEVLRLMVVAAVEKTGGNK